MSFPITIIYSEKTNPDSVKLISDLLCNINEKFNNEFTQNNIECQSFITKEQLDACKASSAILVDPAVPYSIILEIDKALGFFATVKTIKSGENKYLLISEAIPSIKSEFKPGNIGREGMDQISHSELAVEKIARCAYEFAEQNNYKLTNIDNAERLSSSFIWRKIVNDINEDYPKVMLENTLIEDFPIVFNYNHNKYSVLLTDALYENIVLKTIATLPDTTIKTNAHLNETNVGLYRWTRNEPANILETMTMMFRNSFNMDVNLNIYLHS